MTIMMSLEIEEGVSFDELSLVLCSMGDCSVDAKHLIGNFRYSNCYFVFRYVFPSDDVATDGVLVDWKVGVRGAFHCSIEMLAECSEDIKMFLENFSKEFDFKFVFSFQYESVYAWRDEFGMSFLKSMIEC